MIDTKEIAKDNALSDAKELAKELGRHFKDADILDYTSQGINLVAAAERYVEISTSDNSFMKDLRRAQLKYGKLTVAQRRGALNVMRQEVVPSAKPVTATDPRSTREYKCFKCSEVIVGIDNLYAHKKVCGKKVDPEPVLEEEESPVIAVTTSTLNLDLSALPNGRYAAPDLNNDRDNDFLFFQVTRVKKDKTRNRRYKYSKFVTGNERVPAGTIELKEWSSDSRRLFGEQRPGDGEVYKGEFEEHLQMILANPEPWARIFGQMIGRCFRCGKKLTDEYSRDMGFGPECAKHINEYRR